MYRSFLCLVLCSAVLVQGEIKDCGSKIGTVTSVTVTDCNTGNQLCPLKRNTNATISIGFKLAKNVEKVTADVHGVILNLPVPFPLNQPDGCSNSGLSCPLSKDGQYQYSTTLSVLKSYPKLKVTVKWELKDENGEDIVCILIPSEIK